MALCNHVTPCVRYHPCLHRTLRPDSLFILSIFIPVFLFFSHLSQLASKLFSSYPLSLPLFYYSSPSTPIHCIVHHSNLSFPHSFPHPCIHIDIILVYYSSIVIISNRKVENNISSVSLKAWGTPSSRIQGLQDYSHYRASRTGLDLNSQASRQRFFVNPSTTPINCHQENDKNS